MTMAVAALTLAACGEPAPAVTADEATDAMATNDNVEAAAEDAETSVAAPII